MKGLEAGKDKVKKICEILKRETLEPAQKEAQHILERAKQEADIIVQQAQEQAHLVLDKANKEIARERNVFHSSMEQACKQAVATLKQDIEERLLSPSLTKLISASLNDSKIVARLILAIVESIEKQGIDTDLSIFIAQSVDPREVNLLLSKDILEKLREKSVVLGPMQAGVTVKLHNENISIDMTDVAVKELLSHFVRKDFRELFFFSK